METPAQGVAGYYIWEIPGKPLAVHLHLDVIDGLLSALLRGFGTLPKRGAEVGGILLGSIDPGDPAIVRVEDFEVVPCEYRRGPSYLFTDEDRSNFETAYGRWKPDPSRQAYAVGYFRSDTRDAPAFGAEDVHLMDRFFPAPYNVALLIKPFVSKASVAGFFFREAGAFPAATPLEFPFRGRELADEEDPRAVAAAASESGASMPRLSTAAPPHSGREPYSTERYRDRAKADRRPLVSRRLVTWAWIPMSFIFLLLGVLLGFQAELTMASRPGTQDFSLSLSATKTGDNLSVKWNGRAPVVRIAPRGALDIEDGAFKKSVDLDAAQLLNGSVLYRNTSNSVRFRLVVYPNPRTNVVETFEWHQ